MPDTNPMPEPSTIPRPSRRPISTGSLDQVAQSPAREHRIHIVMQGKGGVGKTLIASMLGQYYAETGRPVTCYDTDPVNDSLSAIVALRARRVALLEDDHINAREIDGLIEAWVADAGDAVVDNGAASFVPFSGYLIENDIAGLLAAHGAGMVIHVALTGGGSAMHTLRGLEAIIEGYPPSVRVVVWLNEFFGAVEVKGVGVEDTKLYQDNRDRILGIVRLPRLNQHTFGHDVRVMLERRLTFAEAIESPEFMLVSKQRLTMTRRSIFGQLATFL